MAASASASATPVGMAISSASQQNASLSLPEPVQSLVHQRTTADTLLQSQQLELELAQGHLGTTAQQATAQLADIIHNASQHQLNSRVRPNELGRKLTHAHEARILFIHAWALSRIGEYDGTTPEDLPKTLEQALLLYDKAASLLQLQQPPQLDQVPSVTRPNDKVLPLVLDEQPAWVAELLAEWARTQTTLAFSMLVLRDQVIDENKLADLLELACRRNVQALFTPLDSTESGAAEDSPSEANTVMGNARLIRDMSTMFPFTSTSPQLWQRRIQWATHVADVRFVEASMSANRLVDAAAVSAAILQQEKDSITDQRRNEVRTVLEGTIRRLVPFEKTQGSCLLGLGRIMLQAVGSLYLGGTRKDVQQVESEGEADEVKGQVVPENELVRETRQVLIRAAGMFQNAYASFRRTPVGPTTSKEEQRILTKLEAAYCDLEELDNDTPEVVELRSQRVDRALWINERLVKLHDEVGEESESGGEEVESDEELLVQSLGRTAL
ncbi:hypothetical protein T439DRAFT_323433 [Meredithblackwellia eburnea MCA 4105]